MKFDRDKIPYREWRYEDEAGEWAYGVILDPQRGIFYWGERYDKDDGGGARESFEAFLRGPAREPPAEISREIRAILEAARIK